MLKLTAFLTLAAGLGLTACGPSSGGGQGATGGTTGAAGAGAGAPTGGSSGTGSGGAKPGSGGSVGTGGRLGSGGAPGAGGTTTVPTDAGRVNLNGRKALLVVGSAGSLDDGELLLKEVLEEHGMTVTVADPTGPSAMATGQNVVIATDQADAATFAATFANVAVPMIAFGNSHFVSLGWIGKNAKGTVNTSAQLAIIDASTPLSSDFKAGQTFAAVLSSTSASFYWGTPTGKAIQVASVMGAPTQMVAFGYEAGASTGTATAPARRVGLGLKTNVIQNLTVDGFKLLEAALDWTA
ncbi:MAG: hypothetical protein ABUR63_02375, partial [Verrucomicrobiota bacterium]